MSPEERLRKIAEIIASVDQRCMHADGPVTPTLQEMTQEEISEIYELASRWKNECTLPDKKDRPVNFLCPGCGWLHKEVFPGFRCNNCGCVYWQKKGDDHERSVYQRPTQHAH